MSKTKFKAVYVTEDNEHVWDHVKEKSKKEKISIGYLLLQAYAKLYGLTIKKYQGRNKIKKFD